MPYAFLDNIMREGCAVLAYALHYYIFPWAKLGFSTPQAKMPAASRSQALLKETYNVQFCEEPPRPRGSALSLGPPGFELEIRSVIWFF